MTSREKFEAWWEENYHNGNPPRFGWEAWRDGDGYKIDDDESELDGMWQAWQAAESASEQKLEETRRELRSADATIHNLELKITDMAVQLANAESKCRELAAELSAVDKIHNEAVFITDDHYEQCPPEVQKMIRSLAVLQIPAYDAYLAEVRAQGVERMIEVKRQQLDGMHPDTFAIGAVRDSIRRDIYELKVFAEILRQETAQ
ncbi:hypothetical protein [Citrobacter freundii]|uniref:hypothetical protein n=1 Tax=Citrobacter freundii TaxID=546 RepID=UPI0023B06E0F|nr:hypothetical protein [Citrobacter freundii]